MSNKFKKANEVLFEGAVSAEIMRVEINDFRYKWHINFSDLPHVLESPRGCLNRILYCSDSGMVKKATAEKIRRAIRDYDPRTCQYRKLPREEVAKSLTLLKNKHNFTWKELAEVLGVERVTLRDYVIDSSRLKYVRIEAMRTMLINYNEWLKKRAETLLREAV